MSMPKYRGPVHCLLQILREEGVRGLYRGALPLMLRDGPSYATYFLTYNTLCEWMTPVGKEGPGKQREQSLLLQYTGLLMRETAGRIAGLHIHLIGHSLT